MTLSIGIGAYNMRNEFASILSKFLDSSVSLIEMQEWLLAHLQAILDSGDIIAIDAANEIDADLMSLGGDVIDEATFIRHLYGFRDKLQTVSIKYWEPETANTFVEASQSADLIFIPDITQASRADLRFHLRIGEFSGTSR